MYFVISKKNYKNKDIWNMIYKTPDYLKIYKKHMFDTFFTIKLLK